MKNDNINLMPVVPNFHDQYIPEDFNVIGKRGIRRLDGLAKATAKAIYTRDLVLPGMLCGRFLTSPYAHAKIRTMNTSRAEKLPGVKCVLRYDDPAVHGRYFLKWLFGSTPYYILGDTAHWQNEAVGAAVCAEREEIAEEALELIDVQWEELPFVLEHEDALEASAPIACPEVSPDTNLMKEEEVVRGDIKKGFAVADKIFEFKGTRKAHLWSGPEPFSCIVRWIGDYPEIWVHHQRPYAAKEKIADWFNIPLNKVRIMGCYQGAMFGGFMDAATMSHSLWVVTAILAKTTGRPVKMLYSRRDDFYGASVDITTAHFKVGCKKDGTITAVQMDWVYGNGMYGPADHLTSNTRIPNILCRSKVAYVNKGPVWAFRSENLPNTFAINLICGHVAAELGLDPTHVALKNDGCEGVAMADLSDFKKKNGFPDRDSLNECIENGKKAIGWDDKWHPPGTKRLPNGKMHGLGFVWTHEWSDTWGGGCAGVLIHHDGSVDLIAQHCDVGVNPETTYAQIVAEELGVRIEDINCKSFSDDAGFQLMSPAGACNVSSNGYVVKKAARKAKRKLLELATSSIIPKGRGAWYDHPEVIPAAFPEMEPDQLDVKDSMIYVKADPSRKVSVKTVVKYAHLYYFRSLHEPVFAWAWHYQGLAFETEGREHLTRQTYFMEVEVDTETGEVEITRVVCVNDVGKVISPETCEGQQYGGMYMAVGRNKTEEIMYDRTTGVILNANLLDYKYSTMLDCGPIDTILVETSLGYGPYGSVGIGEDTADSPASILGIAIHNAIDVWIDDYPITPDKILRALGKA